MTQQALGMIETYGLVAAIEAADIAMKTAAVRLVGYEKVKSGRIMVAVSGEVAAVQASVTAGSAAAAKINTVFSRHVIPRPIDDIGLMVGPGGGGPEPAGPGPAGPGPVSPEGNGPEEEGSRNGGPVPDFAAKARKKAGKLDDELDELSVVELRSLARNTKGIAIQGRQISKANKGQLIIEILKARKKN